MAKTIRVIEVSLNDGDMLILNSDDLGAFDDYVTCAIKDMLDDIIDNEIGDTFTIRLAEMDEEEYENLWEFDGF